MDLIYRKDQYNNFLKKLKQLRGDMPDPSDDTVYTEHHMVSKGIETILSHLQSQKEYTHYRAIYGILLIPLFIVLVITVAKEEYWLPMIYLVSVTVFLYIAHMRMEEVIDDNRELADYDSDDTASFLTNKINYISSALDIKASRVQLLMIFWCIFFAPLLVYAYRTIWGHHAFDSLWTSFAIAYLLTIPFWYYYFFQNLKEYAEIDYQLGLYRKHLERTGIE